MQGVGLGLTQRFVDAVGEEAIQTGALVHFVKVGDGFAFADHGTVGAGDRRTFGGVQGAFDEVGSGEQIFETLLILNADGFAAEFIGDADGGHIHFALEQNLGFGEFAGVVAAEMESQSFIEVPLEHRFGFFVGHLRTCVVEGGLGKTFFVNAGLEEEFIGDDRIVHAHAAFVEHAHNGFFAEQVFGNGFAGTLGGGRGQ